MTGQRFSLGTPVSSTNKTDHQDIHVTEILLKMKVALNAMTPPTHTHLNEIEILALFLNTKVIVYASSGCHQILKVYNCQFNFGSFCFSTQWFNLLHRKTGRGT